jgi:hypothetical protein
MMKYGLAVQYIFAFIFRLIGAQLKGVNKPNTTLETHSMYIVHVRRVKNICTKKLYKL